MLSFLAIVVFILSLIFYLYINANTDYIINFGTNSFRKIKKIENYLNVEFTDKILEYSMYSKFCKEELKFEELLNGSILMFDPVLDDGIKLRPAIFYIHGGGWARNSPKAYSNLTGQLALTLNTIVFSLNYGKSPQNQHPIALNKIHQSFQYIIQNSKEFRIDLNHVTIMGDSAGGHLAMGLSLMLYNDRINDQNSQHVHPNINLFLISPILQLFDLDLPSYRDNTDDILVNKMDIAYFICWYAQGNKNDDQCAEAVMKNEHISQDIYERMFENVNWRKYLIGNEYNNKESSYYGNIHNSNIQSKSFSSNWDKKFHDPLFSPLSSLTNEELIEQLPNDIVIFGSTLDPLRDDARLFVNRFKSMKSKKTNLIHREVEAYHDPVALIFMGYKKGWEVLNMIQFEYEALLNQLI